MTEARNSRASVTHAYPQALARALRNLPLITDRCWMERTPIDVLIRAQDHVVSRSQLLEFGLPKGTIQSRLRPGGPWQRVLPATYVAQTGPPSRRQLCRAALLYAAQDSKHQVMLTGVAALELFGLRRLPQEHRVHVLTSHANQRADAGYVFVERTRAMPAEIVRDGLPCVALVRALVDAARHSTDVDVVRAMVAEAVQRSMCTPNQLLRELHRKKGATLARMVAVEVAHGIRSPAEGWLREAFFRFHVPPPEWNAVLRNALTGRVIAVPDALWRGVCVIVEVDSREYHLDPKEWRKTQERHAMLTALGFVVLHFAPSRVKDDPEGVCREVTATLAANAHRPWPRSVAPPAQSKTLIC